MTMGHFKAQFGEVFGLTFGLVFALTLVIFPLIFMTGGTRPEPFPTGFYVLSVLFGLIIFAVPVLLKSALVAPIVFATLIFALSRVLPVGLAFVIAATASAVATSYCSIMIDVNLFPPGLAWRETGHLFALLLAKTAATITILVATPVWFVTRANSESEKYAR